MTKTAALFCALALDLLYAPLPAWAGQPASTPYPAPEKAAAGDLCPSCSRRAEQGSELVLKKAPSSLPEALQHQAPANPAPAASGWTAAQDAAPPKEATARDADQLKASWNAFSSLILPPADCRPMPMPLAFAPQAAQLAQGEPADVTVQAASHWQRPLMPGRLPKKQLAAPSFAPASTEELAQVLRHLSAAKKPSRDSIAALLGSVPGILLDGQQDVLVRGAPCSAGRDSRPANEGSMAEARQLLVVFTGSDCLYCRRAVHCLASLRLPFPVLIMPIGDNLPGRLLYERAIWGEKADADGGLGAAKDSGSSTASAKALHPSDKAAAEWLAQAESWLVKESGSAALSVPAFLWVSDGTTGLSPLPLRSLEALAAAMSRRAQAQSS